MTRSPRKKEKRVEAGHRLLDATALLSRASGATIGELMKELSVSRSTAIRYVDACAQRGLALEQIGEREGHKVHHLPQKKQSQTVTFTLEEVFWLKVMERGMSCFAGTGIDEAIARTVAKTDGTLRPQQRARVTDLARKIVDIPDHVHDYSDKADVVDELLTALLSNQPVTIKQESKRAELRKMRIDPYTLVTHKRALYVVAFSHHHNAIRTFSIDGILAATRDREATFSYPAGYNPRARFEGAFGIMSGEETAVTIRFDASVEPWLRPRRWHPTQSIEKKGRWLLLKMRVRGTTELLSWVLSWGAKATVLAPASLREDWVRQAEAMAASGRAVAEEDAARLGEVEEVE